ncbi:hypothetical protein [Winogradskyella sp. MIT101101]|uniref:hypothetical protein n=1 Tax=Winogradskyella sp. MIT101101 TaxID=3098297 RepID=UPI00399C03E1
MPLIHKFRNELIDIEENQNFCGEKIKQKSNILIIGTFNPDNQSCVGQNNASWFYGRNQSKFWRYFPNALTGNSLHPNDGIENVPEVWKSYCLKNGIVIIDLIKTINKAEILENFSDREVEHRISEDLSNTDYFDVKKAFKNINFERVVYSLRWTDNQIQKMRRIKNLVNQELIEIGSIQNLNQIKYCNTPSRNDAQNSWNEGVNG